MSIERCCHIAVILFILSTLTGCEFTYRNTVGLFWEDEPNEVVQVEPDGDVQAASKAGPAPTKTAALEDRVRPSRSAPLEVEQAIQVLWQIPEEQVEGFILYHGKEPERLDQEIKIPVSQVKILHDPQHGRVFSYDISGLSPSETIYVAISAYNGEFISERSPVRPVEPADAAKKLEAEIE